MPLARCSPAGTTAAPRRAKSQKPPESASTCCSATSARRPDCSAKPSCCRSRHFVGQLYDVLVEHQGLLLTLVASDGLSEEEIESAGIADIRRALTVLSQISAEGMSIRGMQSSHPDLPAHSTVAMIVGMVALRSTFFGNRQPSREAIVDELVQAILHGFLHRSD
jgi:hypothetical protein